MTKPLTLQPCFKQVTALCQVIHIGNLLVQSKFNHSSRFVFSYNSVSFDGVSNLTSLVKVKITDQSLHFKKEIIIIQDTCIKMSSYE